MATYKTRRYGQYKRCRKPLPTAGETLSGTHTGNRLDKKRWKAYSHEADVLRGAEPQRKPPAWAAPDSDRSDRHYPDNIVWRANRQFPRKK